MLCCMVFQYSIARVWREGVCTSCKVFRARAYLPITVLLSVARGFLLFTLTVPWTGTPLFVRSLEAGEKSLLFGFTVQRLQTLVHVAYFQKQKSK